MEYSLEVHITGPSGTHPKFYTHRRVCMSTPLIITCSVLVGTSLDIRQQTLLVEQLSLAGNITEALVVCRA